MMLFWSLLALMIAAAAFAVLWPLSRVPRFAEETAGVAVYRDQLAEIEQDRARGVLHAAEAEAAKIEVSRRLLGAAAQKTPKADVSLSRRRIASIAALIGIPLLSLSLYLRLGAPEVPDAPLAPRLAKPLEQQDIGILIGRIEERLERFPDQGQGWELIAPIYLRIGRTGDAIAAQERAIQLLGSTVARQITLGEYIRTAHGKITPEAKAAFERALALNEKSSPALFYLGLAAEQGGNLADARKYWSRIVEHASENDQWRIPAQRRLRLIEQKQ